MDRFLYYIKDIPILYPSNRDFFQHKNLNQKAPLAPKHSAECWAFLLGEDSTHRKKMALMGFSAVFCFSFGGGGVKSVLKKKTIKPFQGSLHGLWPFDKPQLKPTTPDESNKRCEQSVFLPSTSRQITSNSASTRPGGGACGGIVFHSDLCFMFQNLRPTAQGQAGHLPSQAPGGFRSVDVLAQTQHANLAQAFCSSLQGVPQGE